MVTNVGSSNMCQSAKKSIAESRRNLILADVKQMFITHECADASRYMKIKSLANERTNEQKVLDYHCEIEAHILPYKEVTSISYMIRIIAIRDLIFSNFILFHV